MQLLISLVLSKMQLLISFLSSKMELLTSFVSSKMQLLISVVSSKMELLTSIIPSMMGVFITLILIVFVILNIYCSVIYIKIFYIALMYIYDLFKKILINIYNLVLINIYNLVLVNIYNLFKMILINIYKLLIFIYKLFKMILFIVICGIGLICATIIVYNISIVLNLSYIIIAFYYLCIPLKTFIYIVLCLVFIYIFKSIEGIPIFIVDIVVYMVIIIIILLLRYYFLSKSYHFVSYPDTFLEVTFAHLPLTPFIWRWGTYRRLRPFNYVYDFYNMFRYEFLWWTLVYMPFGHKFNHTFSDVYGIYSKIAVCRTTYEADSKEKNIYHLSRADYYIYTLYYFHNGKFYSYKIASYL